MVRYPFSRIFVAAVLILLAASLFSCHLLPQPPRFRATHDQQINTEERSFPVSRDIVWRCVRETARENYKLFREDAVQGLILTQWRKQLVRGIGRMSAATVRGVKVEDWSGAERKDTEAFEMRNRLSIIVTGDEDSATVSVTNYYLVRPKNYSSTFYDSDFTEVDYVIKAFSVSDFDTREQFYFLNRIGERLK